MIAVLGLGIAIGTAVADRSATAPPIVYSGQLLGATGMPVPDSTTNSMTLSLYDGADPLADTRLCPAIVRTANVETRAGHFSIPLSLPCADVFEHAEDVWVHLTVNRTTIAPTRASAVPYAVRAERLVMYAGEGTPISSGLFCGLSTATNGAVTSGTLTSWAAVRDRCATTCGSPTAHLCTADEISRTVQAGIPIVPVGVGGWLSSPAGDNADCAGWTSTGPGAPCWRIDQNLPTACRCVDPWPLICCD